MWKSLGVPKYSYRVHCYDYSGYYGGYYPEPYDCIPPNPDKQAYHTFFNYGANIGCFFSFGTFFSLVAVLLVLFAKPEVFTGEVRTFPERGCIIIVQFISCILDAGQIVFLWRHRPWQPRKTLTWHTGYIVLIMKVFFLEFPWVLIARYIVENRAWAATQAQAAQAEAASEGTQAEAGPIAAEPGGEAGSNRNLEEELVPQPGEALPMGHVEGRRAQSRRAPSERSGRSLVRNVGLHSGSRARSLSTRAADRTRRLAPRSSSQGAVARNADPVTSLFRLPL